jgi:two-component system cell cycle sensor histidine kinase/response regulator CckA
VEASNGEEALRAAEVYEGEIQMVLTDMVMPRMCGKELTEQVKERCPCTPVMLMSGYTGEELLSQETPLLNKPFIIWEMLSMVRQILYEGGRSISNSFHQLDLWPDEKQ